MNKSEIVNAVVVEEFLRTEISELKELEEYIYQESNKEVLMIIETDVDLQIINFEGSDNEYFMVYVGEQYEDHKVN